MYGMVAYAARLALAVAQSQSEAEWPADMRRILGMCAIAWKPSSAS